MPESERYDRAGVHPDAQREHQVDLLSLTPGDLRDRVGRFVRSRHEPAYRVDQVVQWVYGGEACSIAEMTNLPHELRRELERSFALDEPKPARVSRSADGTVKHLWRLHDGELIESVLIPTGDRLTLCLSSQAGCAMGCTFCATGWAGFARQLTAGEIVAQFRASRRWAATEGCPAISNVVYMGMGEPLANREPVMASLMILNQGYGVGARRITVSTVGLVPGILDLARRPEQFRLAVSLHAPDSELRRELIPLEKRHPLPELLEALRTFDAAGGKRITFEYTMIKNVNDDPGARGAPGHNRRRTTSICEPDPLQPHPVSQLGAEPARADPRVPEGASRARRELCSARAPRAGHRRGLRAAEGAGAQGPWATGTEEGEEKGFERRSGQSGPLPSLDPIADPAPTYVPDPGERPE